MDRFRSFFELFGGKPTKVSDKKPKQEAGSKSKRSGSKLNTKSRRTKCGTSAAGKNTTPKSKPVEAVAQANNSSSTEFRPISSSSHLANVFAPRLLHLTSQITDDKDAGNEAHWVSVKQMAANGYHCAAYLVYCAEHDKVAVTKPSMHQAMWMPFTAIPPNQSWEESSQTGLLIVLSGKFCPHFCF